MLSLTGKDNQEPAVKITRWPKLIKTAPANQALISFSKSCLQLTLQKLKKRKRYILGYLKHGRSSWRLQAQAACWNQLCQQQGCAAEGTNYTAPRGGEESTVRSDNWTTPGRGLGRKAGNQLYHLNARSMCLSWLLAFNIARDPQMV